MANSDVPMAQSAAELGIALRRDMIAAAFGAWLNEVPIAGVVIRSLPRFPRSTGILELPSLVSNIGPVFSSRKLAAPSGSDPIFSLRPSAFGLGRWTGGLPSSSGNSSTVASSSSANWTG